MHSCLCMPHGHSKLGCEARRNKCLSAIGAGASLHTFHFKHPVTCVHAWQHAGHTMQRTHRDLALALYTLLCNARCSSLPCLHTQAAVCSCCLGVTSATTYILWTQHPSQSILPQCSGEAWLTYTCRWVMLCCMWMSVDHAWALKHTLWVVHVMMC